LFVKDYKSDKLCEMAFHICLNPEKFQEFLKVKQIPLVLLDLSKEKISDRELFEYFFPSRIDLLDAYLRVNPDLKLFQKLKSLFEEWHVENEQEVEKKWKIKGEIKEIESKLNGFFEDYWIDRIKKNPKLYKSSPQEVKNNKKILLAFPTNYKFASDELRKDDDLIHQLIDHKYFYLIFKSLPKSYRMQRKYALLAIKSSTKCFKHIEKSIIDKEFILKMCEYHPESDEISKDVVLHFPTELFKDTELVVKMFFYTNFEFSTIPIECRSIPEIATAALKQVGFNYIYLGENLKDNLEYVKCLVRFYPPYFQNYVPNAIKSDPKIIRELIEFNPSLFSEVGEEFQTKENFIICLENFENSNYPINKNKIPHEFKISSDLMEFGIQMNPKTLICFSEENEFFPYGLLKHIKLLRREFERKTSKVQSFEEFYFSYFPNLEKYLKTEMILETKKDKNKFYHLEHFDEISVLKLIGDSKIFRKIGLCLNGIYECLSYDDEKIGKLNDLEFKF
jgi:hypothetical protein